MGGSIIQPGFFVTVGPWIICILLHDLKNHITQPVAYVL